MLAIETIEALKKYFCSLFIFNHHTITNIYVEKPAKIQKPAQKRAGFKYYFTNNVTISNGLISSVTALFLTVSFFCGFSLRSAT